MKHLKLFSLATALLVSVITQATAAPVTYQVDPSHTYPRFSYSHFGLSNQLSSFRKTTGTVTFDAKAKTGQADITIDMTTVNTGLADFDEHLRAEDFFDTAKHPTANFKSTRVLFEGDKPSSIEGLLTIKGITKAVTLTITSFIAMEHPMVKRPAIGANAFTVIKRSEFGAGKYAPFVGDDVRIDIAIEAIAQ